MSHTTAADVVQCDGTPLPAIIGRPAEKTIEQPFGGFAADAFHVGSDNQSGIGPAVWAAMSEADFGHAHAYGDDAWTRRADALRTLFKTECEVYFVFNGNGGKLPGARLSLPVLSQRDLRGIGP